MEVNWLTKLLLAHLLTDFLLQPTRWVKEKNNKHFSSGYLYLHTVLTALLAWIFTGWMYWQTALIIFTTHTLIDGWKSYQPDKVKYFLIDQFLHLLVIMSCWWFSFYDIPQLKQLWIHLNSDNNLWIIVTAVVFLVWPSAIMIGQLTKKWREQLVDSETLGNAGKWIGIVERILILIFVLRSQYEVIGLLMAAKGLLRFNENNRPEIKTEYLLIGTLISISLAIITGLTVNYLIS
ncbi:MAG: hypothetical protein JWM28_3798 [Chitinophagaceae bacterium]|nr:hypothetical protein [Chitinophagaceae bacterium]